MRIDGECNTNEEVSIIECQKRIIIVLTLTTDQMSNDKTRKKFYFILCGVRNNPTHNLSG